MQSGINVKYSTVMIFTTIMLLLPILIGSYPSSAVNNESSYVPVRVEGFKYTYKIDDAPGTNYFIYSGDGFTGYIHVSDICGGQSCEFKPVNFVYKYEDYLKIKELEGEIIGFLRDNYGLKIPYRGDIYLVDNSRIVIVIPVISSTNQLNREKVSHDLKAVVDRDDVSIVLKTLPHSSFNPKTIREASEKITPILDQIYNNSSKQVRVDGRLVKELENALRGLNNGKLPGIAFSLNYEAIGCLGIALDGINKKPSMQSVAEFVRVLREIVGDRIPIIIEAEQGSPIPLGSQDNPPINNGELSSPYIPSILSITLIATIIPVIVIYSKKIMNHNTTK